MPSLRLAFPLCRRGPSSRFERGRAKRKRVRNWGILMLHRNLLALSLALVVAVPASAQSKRPITVDDLWKVQRLGKPAISPDGKWVAAEVTKFSMEANDSTSDLWLFSTD